MLCGLQLDIDISLKSLIAIFTIIALAGIFIVIGVFYWLRMACYADYCSSENVDGISQKFIRLIRQEFKRLICPLIKRLKPESNEDTPGEHTSLLRFSGFAFTFSIIWLLTLAFMAWSLVPSASNTNWPMFGLFILFIAAYLYTVSVTFWMFRNLVQGRYSIDVFELRWQMILGIEIDDGREHVETKEWKCESN